MQGRNAGRPKNAEISLNRVEAAAPPSTPDRPASAAGRKIYYAGRVIRKTSDDLTGRSSEVFGFKGKTLICQSCIREACDRR